MTDDASRYSTNEIARAALAASHELCARMLAELGASNPDAFQTAKRLISEGHRLELTAIFGVDPERPGVHALELGLRSDLEQTTPLWRLVSKTVAPPADDQE